MLNTGGRSPILEECEEGIKNVLGLFTERLVWVQ